jgi:hypothetical protein
MAREFDKIKVAMELRRDLSGDRHAEYSACMQTVEDWHREKGKDAAAAFQSGVTARDPTAREINACRSMTKDFWRNAFLAMELSDASATQPWVRELGPRHDRFVRAVKPLDILEGYGADDMAVYQFPLVLPRKESAPRA